MELYLVKINIAIILSCICCGIAGAYLVARRLVFIGGGITHASFGGIGLGYLVGINPIYTALAFAVGASVSIEHISKKKKLREDTFIAVLWALGMALGMLFIHLTPGYTPDLMPFLFGNILSISWTDIYGLGMATALLVLVFSIYYYPILFHAFDPQFLRASKKGRPWLSYIVMALVGATMIFNVRVMGIVLLMAMLTIPQMTAAILSKGFKPLVIYSILFSLIGTLGGVWLLWHLNLPSGVSIVLCQTAIFGIVKGIDTIRRSKRTKASQRKTEISGRSA